METKKSIGEYFPGDKAIWIIVAALSFVGLIEVYSATSMLAWKYQGGNTVYYVLRHLFFLALGFLTIFGLCRLSYKNLTKVVGPLFWGSVCLLGLTLLMGSSTNDAKRWFTIPLVNISFQTSDLAKLTLMLYLAKTLSICKDSANSKRKVFVKCLIAVGATCVLILPANLSTALLIAGTSVILMVVGRIPLKWIGGMILAFAIGGIVVIGFCKLAGIHTRVDTWMSRISTFSSDDADKRNEDFQAEQAKIAVGRGGVIGQGPGNSVQRNSIPHPYSDFIFAILVEEFGIVGALAVLIAYSIFFYRCIMIVKGLDRTFPAYIVVGLALNIVLQAVSHVLVVTGIMPVTGQPLPFLSMGGTHMIFTSAAVGIILNISRYSGKTETEEVIEQYQEPEEVEDYPFIAG